MKDEELRVLSAVYDKVVKAEAGVFTDREKTDVEKRLVLASAEKFVAGEKASLGDVYGWETVAGVLAMELLDAFYGWVMCLSKDLTTQIPKTVREYRDAKDTAEAFIGKEKEK